jgi:transcription antitermination factor NusG
MNQDMNCDRWFALVVRTRWEGSTTSLLRGKGFEAFHPTYLTRRRSGGQFREVTLPLFPGYLFCRFDAQKRLPILITPGVISIVGSGKIPIPVDDSEIADIKTVVQSGVPAAPWPYLEIGERVRVEDPVMGGLEGILLSFRGTQRIVISVSLLRRSVALEIERFRVVPVRSKGSVCADLLPCRSLSGERVA